MRAGAFLTPRGEFSILIAALAASTAFGPYLQALTMAYVFITSLAASLLLRFLRSGLDRVPVGTTSG
jgi:CPA2 family monovalent cation:H+ antiporter-2